MTVTTSIPDEKRAATIRGLRQLADYLGTHPDLPLPVLRIEVVHYTHGDTARTVVEQAADVLDVGTRDDSGYFFAERRFAGDVTYRVHHTSPERMAAHWARDSYTQNVQVA